MFIVIHNWKRRVLNVITIIALLIAFAFAAPLLAGKLSQQIPVFSDWFAEEHPSGNPMRVENNDASGQKFDLVIDQMVIKMQDFYKDDAEEKAHP
ncbi:MAG TPA: hypothetical protein PKN87_02840 [Syntrophomonadaceae bacterium]|nr:hypothetical protein [Syntrophomonadaceae bacterium]HPR92540.1 hypothetical protein [Syntrophomonadaceae bacterium]